MLYADSYKSVAVHLISSREDIMNMHRGRYRFFRWLLLVLAIMQLIACGKLTHSAPNITSADNATFYINIPGSFTITATGYPNPAFTVTGTLPSGVTFDSSSGTLSGMPASGSIGVYPLTITASNGTSPDATQNFTLTVTSKQVLIVSDGSTTDPVESSVIAALSTIVTNEGFTPVLAVGTDIAAYSLGDYRQVWDVQDNNTVLTSGTSGEISLYTNYLLNGGTLVLLGGNETSYSTRNGSIVSLIGSLGGGSVTVTDDSSGNPQTVVLSTFNQPFTVSPITFTAYFAGGTSNPGTGALITEDSTGFGTAIFYDRSTLSSAVAGRLLVVFAIDFFESAQNLTYNMVVLP
jgi:hypothetical protein